MIAPAELPVGVITALCGAPYFIFLMRRKGADNAGHRGEKSLFRYTDKPV